MKHSARAVFDAFSTRQALGIFNNLPIPGMQAHINPNGAAKRADAALDTALRIGDHATVAEYLNMMGFAG